MENMELMKLSQDKSPVRHAHTNKSHDSQVLQVPASNSRVSVTQGPASDEDVSPKQSKSSPIAKTSSKLFFISRFKGKKQKANGAGAPKASQSGNGSPRTPELDPKVLGRSSHPYLNNTFNYMSSFRVHFIPFILRAVSCSTLRTLWGTRASSTCSLAFRGTAWTTRGAPYKAA